MIPSRSVNPPIAPVAAPLAKHAAQRAVFHHLLHHYGSLKLSELGNLSNYSYSSGEMDKNYMDNPLI